MREYLGIWVQKVRGQKFKVWVDLEAPSPFFICRRSVKADFRTDPSVLSRGLHELVHPGSSHRPQLTLISC
jgi:hypothetical protein